MPYNGFNQRQETEEAYTKRLVKIKSKVAQLCKDKQFDAVALQECDVSGKMKELLEREKVLSEYKVFSKADLVTLVKSSSCRSYFLKGSGRQIPRALAAVANIPPREYFVVNVHLLWDKRGSADDAETVTTWQNLITEFETKTSCTDLLAIGDMNRVLMKEAGSMNDHGGGLVESLHANIGVLGIPNNPTCIWYDMKAEKPRPTRSEYAIWVRKMVPNLPGRAFEPAEEDEDVDSDPEPPPGKLYEFGKNADSRMAQFVCNVSDTAIIVLVGPSGAGKTTICNWLADNFPESFGLAVSHTTREVREGEKQGRDYWFVSKEEFSELKSRDQFIESAEFVGRSYGMAKDSIMTPLNARKHVVTAMDMHGVKQLEAFFGMERVWPVLILPPSWEELIGRLTARQSWNQDELRKRLKDAEWQMTKGYAEYPRFRKVVVNKDYLEAAPLLKESIDDLTSKTVGASLSRALSSDELADVIGQVTKSECRLLEDAPLKLKPVDGHRNVTIARKGESIEDRSTTATSSESAPESTRSGMHKDRGAESEQQSEDRELLPGFPVTIKLPGRMIPDRLEKVISGVKSLSEDKSLDLGGCDISSAHKERICELIKQDDVVGCFNLTNNSLGPTSYVPIKAAMEGRKQPLHLQLGQNEMETTRGNVDTGMGVISFDETEMAFAECGVGPCFGEGRTVVAFILRTEENGKAKIGMRRYGSADMPFLGWVKQASAIKDMVRECLSAHDLECTIRKLAVTPNDRVHVCEVEITDDIQLPNGAVEWLDGSEVLMH